MNNDINTGLKYLNSDYLINVSIIDPIKRNTAEVLYASRECVMIKDKTSGVVMLQTENIELADSLLDNLPYGTDLVVVHNPALADLVERKLGYDKRIPCYQSIYRKEPFKLPESDIEIRLLREDEAEAASQMYHFTVEDAIRHIRLGLVYGGFENGEMVAMIGQHYQGSMGLLEVKQSCRRKGYGEFMEKFLINSLLEKGLIPYCQIIEDNAPSLALQSKLGLDVSENKLFWMRKKRPDEQEEHPCART